ncbi:MAG: 2-oxoglutarate dehydrogenase E1 component, partial [Armatimonadetes bacterium]|nr:2-oxoglutarate dehydrogenase E1 component [Armatimonadota bacterium]
ERLVRRVAAAARYARIIRQQGHLGAHVNPLDAETAVPPELGFAANGLEVGDLDDLPASVVGGPLAETASNAAEAVDRLRGVYSGSIGYDLEHVTNAEERYWLRDAAESGAFQKDFDAADSRKMLKSLTEVEAFEQYLHQTYAGAKRFSVEGTDMLVPMLSELLQEAAAAGAREWVLGMAHRGRLNVLAHILCKPYEMILSEFHEAGAVEEAQDAATETAAGWSGDVKYHLGARGAFHENGTSEMQLTLLPNPSHLEFVNPVVEGHTRAAQDLRQGPGAPSQETGRALAVLVHGDAAFPGQGIVAETLNLSRLFGYNTGGTIHIIANNQIGFTTDPDDGRSTLYASDLAKGFEVPIVHVNADDPAACTAVAHMAFAYRERFHKDFLIDLIGYRRYGHNEGDEPAFTQPVLYEAIRNHPTVRMLWLHRLVSEGIVTLADGEAQLAAVRARLQVARAAARGQEDSDIPVDDRSSASVSPRAVTKEELESWNDALLQRPESFHRNVKLEEQGANALQKRRELLHAVGGIQWAHAEALAFAAVLTDGTAVRMSGQDTQRGTFSQRHLVLRDSVTGDGYVPLQHLPSAKAPFAIYNSPLSENACLGFEYGYSMHAPGVLVLWEAQFGDFANSAQVIIDQFIVSGSAKWRQTPSLVLLLPHGYEGQGSEHSSARLERYLQLAADRNICVVNCTTPGQYFHLLRRHVASLLTAPRPLIVMAPKKLLRLSPAMQKDARLGTSLDDLVSGAFQPVIRDREAERRARSISRLILCTGKVYAELIQEKRFIESKRAAAVRIEELYPFPGAEIRDAIAAFPNLIELVWLQEEPRNMGAWSYIAPRILAESGWQGTLTYIGRPESASPAEGSQARHDAEQRRVLDEATSDAPAPAELEIARAG